MPGVVDARIQQPFDYPDLEIDVDRTKALQSGLHRARRGDQPAEYAERQLPDRADVLPELENGVNYNLPRRRRSTTMQSLRDLQNIPVTGRRPRRRPAILADVATIKRSQEMAAVDHYNIRRVVDIYAIGAGSRPRRGRARHHAHRRCEPRRTCRAAASSPSAASCETMHGSYQNLLGGLGFSIVLVYLLIVVNFQSWLDPFIIITALPAALAGIVLMPVLHRTRR